MALNCINEYLINIALKKLMENNCKYSANQTSNILIANQEGGIDMALAHKIITLHKGEIEVKSKSGHGTTFCVEIPNE